MREITVLTLLGLLAACSGGSGTALESASLRGTVVELDGQTVDRSGVSVSVVETGETTVTDVGGSFSMAQIPTGTVTLEFGPGSSQLAIDDVSAGDQVEVRCSIDDGALSGSSSSGNGRVEAEARAENGALEAKVEVESRTDGEKLKIEVEGLAPGDVVDLTLDGAALASIPADAAGQAKLERIVSSAADLAGATVGISLASTGQTLFEIEVPALPSAIPGDGNNNGDRLRGKARLAPINGTAEGYVEIRNRTGEQRFKMEAERLAAGTAVAFFIEDQNNAGTFVRLAGRVADAGGAAEINTQDGLPMPLGVSNVADLVGLEVRVTLDDGSGQVLLSGIVPPLIAD